MYFLRQKYKLVDKLLGFGLAGFVHDTAKAVLEAGEWLGPVWKQETFALNLKVKLIHILTRFGSQKPLL